MLVALEPGRVMAPQAVRHVVASSDRRLKYLKMNLAFLHDFHLTKMMRLFVSKMSS